MKKNSCGFSFARGYHDAKLQAADLGLDKASWKYLATEDQVKGLTFPHERYYYFINWDIPEGVIFPQIRRNNA